MSRLPVALVTALLTLLLGVGSHAVAGAAPASGPSAPAGFQADVSDDAPDAEDETGEDDAEDPDAVDFNLDFCDMANSPGEADDADDPGADDEPYLRDDEDLGEDEDTPEEDQPVDCDEEDTADDDDATTTKASAEGDKTVLLKTLLTSGTVDGGTVTMSGPGTVTQELLLPGAGKGAKPRAVMATSTKVKAAAPRGKVLAGTTTKTVRKAGKVRLTVHLNQAGRSALRKAKKDVTITVRTVTRVKGKKAQTKTRTVHVKLKGVKKRG